MSSTLAVLTDPDGFFAAKARDAEEGGPGYLRPALVVAADGVVGAVAAYLLSSLVLNALPQNARSVGGFVAVFGAVGGFLGPFLIWVVASVVFFVFSVFADGDGALGETFAFVGWGFVPRVLGSLVSLALTYVGLRGVTPPGDVSQYQPFVTRLQHRPIFLVQTLLGLVFLCWSGFLWTFALKHARGLTLRSAALVVYVPVAVYALYKLVTLVT